MLESLTKFWLNMMASMEREEGQTLVEYAFLVAFIALVVLVAVTLLGTNLATLFNSIAGKV